MIKLTMIGNVGNDATIKESNGKKFAAFSLANSESYTDKNGTKVEKTQWVNCIINDAEKKVIPFIKKGTKVYIEGKPSVKTYKSEASKDLQIDFSCTVSIIELLTPKPKEETANNTAANEPQSQDNFDTNIHDDLPF